VDINAFFISVPHDGSMDIAPTGGLGVAMQHAQRGLRDATERFAEAAERIAAIGVARAPPADASLLTPQTEPDLPFTMTDAVLAQRAYIANLLTVRTADEMAEDLLRSV
jgi:hypothetical protein